MSPTSQLTVDLSTHLAGGPGWATGVTTETTPAPTPGNGELRPGLEPTDVSPGLPGFLTMFAVALACVVLFLSLNKKLRKVRHNERSGQAGVGGSSNDGAFDGGSPSNHRSSDQPSDGPSHSSSDSSSSGGDGGGGGD